ncbi:MAG: 1-acyl-sn-glycerol-3-phosphate acyltransferase [Bacteroidales bacterium]|nr:1-acyl-sn-glycerol-3-phosphate acyltransferase [Bacteroidales bacterium]
MSYASTSQSVNIGGMAVSQKGITQAPMPMRIDVAKVIEERLPRKYRRWIPQWAIRWLERTICQDQLNEMLRVNAGKEGSDFCRGVLEHLGITLEIQGKLPDRADKQVMIVSNHPLGGLDGMALIMAVADHYGVEPLFVVNDLLMAVEPLRPVFVPVNKHGRQSRQAVEAMDKALRSDRPVLYFPAGLVSRRSADGGIADLRWQKTFVNKCKETGRTVVPCFFDGENTPFFYNFARRRERLGLKFNIEMVYLPREVFRCKGSHFTITFGQAVTAHSLEGGARAQATADALRATVYSLRPVTQK